MAFGHGKDSTFSMDDTADSLTDITAYVTNVEGLPGENDLGETTTQGKEAKTYISGLHDATITVALMWDATMDGLIGSVAQQKVARGIQYGPVGTTAGNVKVTCETLIKSYKVGSPVGDVVTATLVLQKTGDVTIGTF